MNHGLGNNLFAVGYHRVISAAIGISYHGLTLPIGRRLSDFMAQNIVSQEGPFNEAELMDSRFTQPLHGQQADLQPGRFGGIGPRM